MNAVTVAPEVVSELSLVKVAREIAMDIHPLETILNRHGIDAKVWDNVSQTTYFQGLLTSEIAAWGSALNTAERVKLKSLSFVEESLPEFYARAHDPAESLNAKVEVLKTVARFAGIGGGVDRTDVVGEKFTVTINLGTDQSLKIEKDVTPRVIDAEDA